MDSIMGFAQQFLETHQPQNEDDRQLHHAAVNEAKQNIDSHQDPDPDQVRQAHQQIYQNGQVPEDSDPSAIGGAIVTQVMSQLQSSGGSGGDMQQQLLSSVMNEASSVMGGSGGGLKQKVMVQAAMMAMKAQLGGSGGGGGGMFGGMMSHVMGGGGGGGGMDPSTLLSIASKFM